MRCPLCDATMRAVNRRGVEVDVCPECKGIWLDRGELEKLMAVADDEEDEFERRVTRERPRDEARDRDDVRRSSSDDRERRRYDDDDYRRAPAQHKKKSWFSQMMETVGGEGADD